jgi:predicted ArsR family transcriptional regulator
MREVDSEPTRNRILGRLRDHGQTTIYELAEDMGITHISVRHHLSSLQADRLVESREERHGGVGRPRRVYRLTETALELNPAKYLKLTNVLLDQLKEHLPQEMVEKLLFEVAASMAGGFRVQLEGLPFPQRIKRLIQLLSQEGFVAQMESVGPNQYSLTELACPYAKISLKHPEMCVLDASIISRALDASVERKTCIRTGADSCTFAIVDSQVNTHD